MSKAVRRIQILLTAFALFGLPIANAGTVNGATVTGVMGEQGAFFVFVNLPISGQPACATIQRFATDPNSSSGKAIIATILSAWSAGRHLNISGNNSCNVWGDTESIDYLYAY